VDLYVLTTYTNRDDGDIQSVFYFSDRFRRYDYGNTGTVREFLPLLRTRTGPDAKAMSHLQDFGATMAETFETILANIPREIGEEPFIQVLRQNNLFRATLEVSELFLPVGHSTTDLTDFEGDEHTVVYRGEQRELVRATSDTIGLQFLSETPTPNWLYADGLLVDPRDLGIRLPLVYGRMKRVQAVGTNVGGETTLASALAAAATTADVTDCERFSSSGVVWVNGERITYSSKNDAAGTLNGLTRGTNSVSFDTEPADHPAGSQVVEVQASTFTVAGHPVNAIGNVYVRKSNGKIMRLTSGFTKTPSHAGEGPDGETVATVRLTAAQMEDLLNSVQNAAAVTQQPSVNQQTTIETFSYVSKGGPDADLPIAGWIQALAGWSGASQTTESGVTGFAPPADDEFDQPGLQPTSAVITVAGDLANGPILNTSGSDFEFFLVIGHGSGTHETLLVAERAAGTYPTCIVLGPYTVPAGGSLAEFEEDVDISALMTTAATGVYVGNMAKDIVQIAKIAGAGSPPSGMAFYVSRRMAGYAIGQVTTDIEVAGDAGSEVQISGEGLGSSEPFSLRVYADVDGAMAADSAYSVADGEILETMPDILRHFIAEFCGEGHGAVDQETFDEALANLSPNVHACDARALGTTFPQVATRMAWESRGNIQRGEEAASTTWRLFTSFADFTWGTPFLVVDQYKELEEKSRDPDSIKTRFRSLYNWDPSVGDTSAPDAFRSTLRADRVSNALSSPSGSDLFAAEAVYGRRDQEPFAFATIRDTPTAQNVMGYFATEAIRASRVWGLTDVPWTQAYALEPGDLVTLAGLPWAPDEVWNARVLSVARSPDTGMASLVLFMTAQVLIEEPVLEALFEAEALLEAALAVSYEILAALLADADLDADLVVSYEHAALIATATLAPDLTYTGPVEMQAALIATATI